MFKRENYKFVAMDVKKRDIKPLFISVLSLNRCSPKEVQKPFSLQVH